MHIKRADYKYLVPVLVAAGLAVYSSSLSAPFVYDDKPFIADNQWIRSLSNFTDLSSMRYVCDLTFALNYLIGGLDPFGYHLVNTFVHILNSILVFFLVGLIFETPLMKGPGQGQGEAPAIAFSSALLFAVHPIQIQAVTYISQRYTSLAVFFYLLSAVLFLKARNTGQEEGGGKGSGASFYLASIASAMLAMKTKEISFTLPFVLTLFELSFFPGERASRRLLRLAPFFIASLMIPLGLLLPSNSANPVEALMTTNKLKEASTISRYGYLLTETTVVTTYLRLILLPIDTGNVYDFPLAKSFFELRVILSSAVLISAMLLTAYLLYSSVRKRNGRGVLIALGAAWFFMTVSVESSIIPIKDVFNERRAYLPSIGIILSAVASLQYGMGFLRRRGAAPSLTLAAFVLTAVLLGGITFNRNRLWNDPLALYADEVRKNPYSHSPRMYLGIEYFERGRPSEALGQFMEAKRLNPSSVYVRKTLSKYYFNMGMPDEALEELKTITSLDPVNREALYNIGVLYVKKGQLNEARSAMEKVLALYPGDDSAKKALQHIIRRQSDSTSRVN
ncbi:MAG: tetratricopeptide repeat protein [Deltaproteobacteria bacterium]|nr:tetratricopeptide repeat protein [Deltaproteobacteria bacterium]